MLVKADQPEQYPDHRGPDDGGHITPPRPHATSHRACTGMMVRGVINPATAGKGQARAGKCHADTPLGPSRHPFVARRAWTVQAAESVNAYRSVQAERLTLAAA